MKNIAKKLFFALTVSLMILAGSCRDYLDIQPQNSYSLKDVFSSVANVRMAVYGIYDMLSGDNGYGIRVSLYFPVDNDEMQVSGAIDGGRRNIGHYLYTSTLSDLFNVWDQFYRGIERANIVIRNIPEMDLFKNGSDADKVELYRLLGEALALRAQFYYEIVRNWGDVPFPTEPSVAGMDFNLKKTDQDTIYDHLLADLKLAEEYVPARKDLGVKDERISKSGIKGLRARIALARGGYALRRSSNTMERRSDYLDYYRIARDECRDIIQDSVSNRLNPSFVDLWKNTVCGLKSDDPYGELLFQAGAAGGSSVSDTKLGYYDGPRTDANSRYGAGGGGILALPTYFYSFDSIDTRRDVTIGYYSIGADNTRALVTAANLNDGKYRREWRSPLLPGSAQYLGYNWVILRLSDVMLMFAEAENELNNGPTSDAFKAFEKVRRRAYRGNENLIGTTPTDKDGFFNAIVKERSLELGGEGIRKYDLIRWNLLGTKLAQAKEDLKNFAAGTGAYSNLPLNMYYKKSGENIQFYNSFYKDAGKPSGSGWTTVQWRNSINTTYITRFAQYFTPNKNELMPINQKNLEANPNLTQDYGY